MSNTVLNPTRNPLLNPTEDFEGHDEEQEEADLRKRVLRQLLLHRQPFIRMGEEEVMKEYRAVRRRKRKGGAE